MIGMLRGYTSRTTVVRAACVVACAAQVIGVRLESCERRAPGSFALIHSHPTRASQRSRPHLAEAASAWPWLRRTPPTYSGAARFAAAEGPEGRPVVSVAHRLVEGLGL